MKKTQNFKTLNKSKQVSKKLTTTHTIMSSQSADIDDELSQLLGKISCRAKKQSYYAYIRKPKSQIH